MAVAAPRARPAAGAALPAPAPPRPARPRARTTARPRPRLARSVVWIAVVAGLLAGIVALNVAVLQMRMERGRLQSEIVQIRDENEAIEAQLSVAASVGRVEAAARGRLGLVEPAEATYLKLNRRRR